jgi:hypothetical protein
MSQAYGSPFPVNPAKQHQLFTSNGTFIVPVGVTSVKVTVVGGGGNDADCFCCGCFGCCWSYGGGGGGAAIKIINNLMPGQAIAVTVGGLAGTSSFGTYCSATGSAWVQSGTGVGGDINLNGTTGIPYRYPCLSGKQYITNGSYFGKCNFGATAQPGAVLVEWAA